MAWDALGNIFQKKEKKEPTDAAGMAAARGGPVSSGNPTPQFSNAAFERGTGGSNAGPVSSGFVNFGTLYDANKEKAGAMAKGVYDKAQSQVDAAKGKLQSAQDKFKGQYQVGLGGMGVIGGKHGTEIASTKSAAEPEPFHRSGRGTGKWVDDKVFGNDGLYTSSTAQAVDEGKPGPGKVFEEDNSGWVKEGGVSEPTRGKPRPGAGSLLAGRSMYDGLYGPAMEGPILGNPEDKANAIDYNHYATELDAKSGAGQDYTGPNSLKDAIGDEDYAALAEDLRKAQQSTDNLTNAGGIATELGYNPGDPLGLSSMDAGLTQVAGQENFSRLAKQNQGLSKSLGEAQADSMKSAGAGKTISDKAAADWQALLDEYEAAQAVEHPGAITLNAASPTLGTNFLKGTMGYGLSNYGLSMQDYNEAGLTDDEKTLLAKEDAGILDSMAQGIDELAGLSADEAKLWQSALAKMRAAKAKRQGGGK